jgi:hypothetical protein
VVIRARFITELFHGRSGILRITCCFLDWLYGHREARKEQPCTMESACSLCSSRCSGGTSHWSGDSAVGRCKFPIQSMHFGLLRTSRSSTFSWHHCRGRFSLTSPPIWWHQALGPQLMQCLHHSHELAWSTRGCEKPSGKFLGFIVMSHWLDNAWIRIRGSFDGCTFILFCLENRVCLSRGVQVAGATWQAAMMIVAGVGDLVWRTRDGQTQVGYSVAG